MDIFLVSGHQNAVRTYICVDKMDEKKDGHMQITTFFDISRLRRLQNLIKKWFWCAGLKKEKRNELIKKNVANSCSRSHFFELMNHLSYIVIDCKISRCIQNMKWGNPNKKKRNEVVA